jgi:hypothetical protein
MSFLKLRTDESRKNINKQADIDENFVITTYYTYFCFQNLIKFSLKNLCLINIIILLIN